MDYVIVDIDGTISKVGDRVKCLDHGNWEEFYSRCDEDEPIYPIVELVQNLSNHYRIYFLTGRIRFCYDKTVAWLDKYKIYGCSILMREDGDTRHDTIVKPEKLQEFINAYDIDKNEIAFILEDRNSMVKKWRELGFTCLQVAEGDF